MKCSGEYCAPCSLTRIKSEGKGDAKVKKKAPLNVEKNVLLTDKALQGEEVMSHFSFLAKRERSTRREPGDLAGRSSLVLQKPVVSRESSCWSRFIDVGSCGKQIRSSLVVIHYSIQLFRHFAVRSDYFFILFWNIKTFSFDLTVTYKNSFELICSVECSYYGRSA